jgi:hypothetical protein
MKCTEMSVPIINSFLSNERHCNSHISSVNYLELVNKKRGENSNLVKKNCGATNAHLPSRRCYNNVSLSDGSTNTHTIVSVVWYNSVVIELKKKVSQIRWMPNYHPHSDTRFPCNVSDYWEYNTFVKRCILQESRDWSVGIARGYGLHGPGSIPAVRRILSSP